MIQNRKSTYILLVIVVVVTTFSLMSLTSAFIAEESQDDSEIQRILEYLSLAEEALLDGEPTETGELLRQAMLAQWSITPLKIENLLHVNREPSFYGDVSLRDSEQYSPGDVLHLYFEPHYYSIQEQDDIYSMHLTVDVKLILEDGTIALHNPKFIDYAIEGTQPNFGFYMNMRFNLSSGIPPGDHNVVIELTDHLSEEKTTAQTLFDFEH